MLSTAIRPLALAATLSAIAGIAAAENSNWGQNANGFNTHENSTQNITWQGRPTPGHNDGTPGNNGHIGQWGVGNSAGLQQSGHGHNAMILQTGNNNNAQLRQRGKNKNAYIVQAGDNTVVRVRQRGKRPGNVIVWSW